MIDDATVRHVARLARLHLEPDELERMREELSGILDHVDAIQALDLDERTADDARADCSRT